MENELIGRCNFCGKQNCIAHRKYLDRCEECGKRYNRYKSYKSLQRSDYTNKRQLKLDAIVDEYRHFKRLGFKVPRDII